MHVRLFFIMAVVAAALLGILMLIGSMLGGLSEGLVLEARSSQRHWQQVEQRSEQATQRLAAIQAEHPAVAAAMEAALAADAQRLAEARETAARQQQEVERLLEADDGDTRGQLMASTSTLTVAADTVRTIVDDHLSQALVMQRLVSEPDTVRDEVAAQSQELGSGPDPALVRAVESAVQDWPDKAADLRARLQSLEAVETRAEDLAASIQASLAQPQEEWPLSALQEQLAELQQLAETVPEEERTLAALVDQLYTSWDEILVDMEIDEGYEVDFYHTIKRVTVAIDPGAADEAAAVEPTESTRRVAVNRSQFERHKQHLGMALRSKPPGHYDHEVETTPQPPGMTYIASPEQGSNRYGHWQERNGTSFWHWYGQYAFMRSLFWGSAWEPIGMRDYRRYQDHRRVGRSWYGGSGRDRRYGTAGSVTRSRYSSSRYVRSGGYRNSQYVRSGGSFRGTRYTQSSSYRSSSYGGGSRSFGGK